MSGLRRRLVRVVPKPIRRRVRAARRSAPAVPPPGSVRLGDLARTTPLDERWGFGRGRPIDRRFIEGFLERHRSDVHGRIIEVAGDSYARRFGTNVEGVEVIHPIEGNPNATIVGDLQHAPHIPDDSFDCAIVTQTLHLIWDVRAALATLHRILRPGGVLLATVPGITKASLYDADRWGDYWRFTRWSAERLARDAFGPDAVQVATYGNVLTAAAFLYGLADRELTEGQLDRHDDRYQVLIAIRARKPERG